MIKRIKAAGILLLGVLLLLAVPLTAFAAGGEDYDEAELKDTAYYVMEAVIGVCSDQASYDRISSMRDAELDYILTSNSYPVSAADFKRLLTSWKAAQEECGVFMQTEDLQTILDQFVMAKETDGVSLSGEMAFADRAATVTLSFARDGTLEALTAGGKYTTGEILKKAGLNTVIGMGTVFAVLILISLVISTFKYIAAFQEKRVQKDAAANQPASAEVSGGTETAAVSAAVQHGEPLHIPDGAIVKVTVRERPVIYVRVREKEL